MTTRRVLSTVVVLGVFAFGDLRLSAQEPAGRSAAPSMSRRAVVPASYTGAATPSRPSPPPPPALGLAVASRITTTPSYVRGLVRLWPGANDRRLRVTVDAPGFARSSEVRIDGTEAPFTGYFYWRDLPPGLYEMTATVRTDDGGVRAVRRLSFAVLAESPSF